MGLTGIIYGSIVVAWAAYLIPLALRRHEEATRARAIDRFSTTMNVLARHGRAGSIRVVVTPPRPGDRILSPELKRTATVTPAAASRPSRAALQAAARRRRRVLLVLTGLLVAVGGAAALHYLPLWSVAVPVVLIVAFLGLARRQVRRASDSFWTEVRAPVGGATNVIRRGSTRVDASHGAARSPDDEPTVPIDHQELQAAVVAMEQEHNVVVPLPTSDGTSLWDPLPIVLPTYVETAAVATTRTVDLSTGSSAAARSSSASPSSTSPISSTYPAVPSDRAESEIWVRHLSGTASGGMADDSMDEEPAKVVNG